MARMKEMLMDMELMDMDMEMMAEAGELELFPTEEEMEKMAREMWSGE